MFGWFKHPARNKLLDFVDQIAKEQDKDHEFTPDLWRLEQRPRHLLFIYDEMMTKMPYTRRGTLGDPICPAFSKEKFSLWKKKAGKETFPIALDTGFGTIPRWAELSQAAPLASIKGELYSVPIEVIKKLDNSKINGVLFTRRRVKLYVPYQEMNASGNPMQRQSHEVKAWMYVGNPLWNDLLDGGYYFSPVKLFNPNDTETDQYYFFTIDEYTRQ